MRHQEKGVRSPGPGCEVPCESGIKLGPLEDSPAADLICLSSSQMTIFVAETVLLFQITR